MSWLYCNAYPVGVQHGIITHELKLALQERWDVATGGQYNPLFDQDDWMQHKSQGWTGSFETNINQLIPYFVNHVDSGGDWDGNLYLPPAWNQTSLMTAIGESRIAAPFGGYPLSVEWLGQQYKILNMLRWTRHYYGDGLKGSLPATANRIVWYVTSADTKEGEGSDWETAVGVLNAAAWVPVEAPDGLLSGYRHYARWSEGNYYYIRRTRFAANITNLPDVTKDIDVYTYFSAGSTPYETSIASYFNGDYPQADNGVSDHGVARTSTQRGHTSTSLAIQAGYFNTNTVIQPPAPPTAYAWTMYRGFHREISASKPLFGDWCVVCKHDISGGFTYVD